MLPRDRCLPRSYSCRISNCWPFGKNSKLLRAVLFVPLAPEGQETRTNRPGFNFILANQLYNRQGQFKFASEHPNFDFPSATKEIKAAWIELSGNEDASKYYSVTSNGKTYGLVALHVITKDTPFWFWSSFVHKDRTKSGQYDAPLADYQDVPAERPSRTTACWLNCAKPI
jgi:hypothetical protein